MTRVPRVYIYCRDEPGNLQEDVIALAEGLHELGVPCHGSCDYWLQSTTPNDYLIRHDPSIAAADCDIVVVSYTWPYWIRMGTFDLVRRPLPEGLFNHGRRYRTVYLDSHDGHRTVSWESEYRQFDFILRSKLNRRSWRPTNLKPWVLGLNQRILAATSGAPGFEERAQTILVNFGASHPYPHGSREAAKRRFEPGIGSLFGLDTRKDDLSLEPAEPYDAMMWRQTGARFSRAYYERLKGSQAVSAFCGELIPPMPFRNPECYLVGGNRAKLRRLFYEALARLDPRPRRSVQWDSFRFWEALAAGCLVFNLDLERYGAELPVMPANWKHYIGVDLEHVDDTIDRVRASWGSLPGIARAGRAWALEHYSPRAMAQRFLGLAGYPGIGAET